MQQIEVKDALSEKAQPKRPHRFATVRRMLTKGALVLSATFLGGDVMPPTIPQVPAAGDQPTSINIEHAQKPAVDIAPLPTVSPTPVETSTPTPSAEPTPTSTPEQKPLLLPKVDFVVSTGSGMEPAIAIDPADPNIVAVTHQEIHANGTMTSLVRISKDGGKHWTETTRPWDYPYSDVHSRMTWSDDGTLYWINGAVVGNQRLGIGISKTTDFGKTWQVVYFNKNDEVWVGHFPDITVDNNPKSPNYGVVYATYNVNGGIKGPKIRVLAYDPVTKEVAKADVPPVVDNNNAVTWRINPQVIATSTGEVRLTVSEKIIGYYDSSNQFANSWNDVLSLEYDSAMIDFDRSTGKITVGSEKKELGVSTKYIGGEMDSAWDSGLAVNDTTGEVWMTAGNAGKIVLKTIDKDSPQSFDLKGVYLFEPTLAMHGNTMFLGFYGKGSDGIRPYYIMSDNDGVTWTDPKLVSSDRWSNGKDEVNGVGLRLQAKFAPDGKNVLFAFAAKRGVSDCVVVASISPFPN